MKYRLIIVWLSAAFFLAACKSTAPVQTNTATEFIILQLNDVYEIAPLEGGKAGGMARVATLRKQLLAENPSTYTVLAGDFLNPSVIGTVKLDGERVRGAHMVDVMNQMGVDLVVFGNHEFDIAYEDLQKRLNESRFDWISGNVRHHTSSGNAAFQRNINGQMVDIPEETVWEVKNPSGQVVKVGILGACLDANRVDYVHYENEYSFAEESFRRLQRQSDFVIGLTHLALEQDQELARKLPGLELIMGGHEHENHYEMVAGVPIAKADANAKSAYVHRLRYDPVSGDVTVKSELVMINEEIIPDPEIDRVVKDWEERAYAAFGDLGFDMNAVVFVAKEPLDGLEKHIRTRPTNLGKMIAEAMFEAVDQADCAIVNGGSVRIDDQLTGNITEFDIVRALPFGGKIFSVKMTGKVLKEVLAAGEQNRGTGGYLQTHKLSTDGNYWYIGDKIIEDESNYQVAISDFLLTGLEANLEFLTRENPGVLEVREPGPGDLTRDIRLVLVEYLKKR